MFVEKQKAAIERLARAEQIFLGPAPPAERPAPASGNQQAPRDWASALIAGSAKNLLSSARMAFALGKYDKSVELCTHVLALSTIELDDKAEALLERGVDYYLSGDTERARADWTALIDLPGAPVERIAWALLNRGFTWGERGDLNGAIADYTQVIERPPGAPVEQVAMALVNRGIAAHTRGDFETALADYTRVIERLPGARHPSRWPRRWSAGESCGKRRATRPAKWRTRRA